MGITTALALGLGGAALGGIAGAVGGDSTKTQRSRLILDPEGELERLGREGVTQDFRTLRQLTDAGPGVGDVRTGLQAQRSFAEQLAAAQRTGGFAQEQDVQQAQNFASQIFAPQRLAAQRQLEDFQQGAARRAALMGRSQTDPILQARLASQQGDLMAMLEAQQGAFTAQQAQNAVGRRLDFGAQRANVLGGLASQAMQNRAALLNTGSQLLANERNFRIATGARETTQEKDVGFGDRLSGALTGILGGFGMGQGAASSFLANRQREKNLNANIPTSIPSAPTSVPGAFGRTPNLPTSNLTFMDMQGSGLTPAMGGQSPFSNLRLGGR